MHHVVNDLRRVIAKSQKTGETFGNSYTDIENIVDFVISRFDNPEVILFAHKEKEKGKSIEEILKSTIINAMIY